MVLTTRFSRRSTQGVEYAACFYPDNRLRARLRRAIRKVLQWL